MSPFSGFGSYGRVGAASGTASTAGGASSGLSGIGSVMMVAGAVSSAIGAYYGALSQRSQLKSQALSLDFESKVSQINARLAEQDAQAIIEAGQRDVGRLGLRAGQAKGAQLASQGARGVAIGAGSAAEELATTELVKQIDAQTININATRAAEAARMQSVNFQNRSLLQNVSAGNLRRTAKSIKPFVSATSSLLGSAGQVSSQWAYANQG